jgi:hypothetical protein
LPILGGRTGRLILSPPGSLPSGSLLNDHFWLNLSRPVKGDGIAILGNRVEVKGGSKSSGILQIGSNGFIARNKIDGSGAFAMRAVPYKDVKTNGNTFAWNDVREFKPSAADFQCIGNKNIFVGAKCNVVDKGKWNNMLTMH